MKGMKLLALVVASTASVISVTSVVASISAPIGWYVEGNVGTSRVQSVNYGTATTTNNSGLAYNANVGYKFMPYFGLEAGYTHYSQTNIKSNGVKAAQSTHYSYDLAGKGILPISDSGVELFAKLGVARGNSHTTITNSTAASGVGIPAGSFSTTGLYIGVGADYSFIPNLSINGQWARVRGNNNVGNLDLYSIGLTWIFS